MKSIEKRGMVLMAILCLMVAGIFGGCGSDDEDSSNSGPGDQGDDDQSDDDQTDDDDSSSDDDAADDDAADDDAADDDAADDDAGDDDDDSEERWPACDENADSQKITFVHINDLHANYTPQPYLPEFFKPQPGRNYDSPASRIVGLYKYYKQRNPYTLLTDGGDDHEKGSVAEPLSAGFATSLVVKAMRFDVRVLGNHDFAWGEEEFLFHSHDDQAIVLASNTTYSGDDPQGFGAVPYGEYQVGCVKIGFFGMCPKPYDETNQSYEGPYMDGFETRFDYAQVAQEIIEAHREDVDLMVMVSHLGLGADRDLAAEVDGIDVILGGHSHSDVWVPEKVDDTLIVQAGSNGQFISHLDLTVELNTMKISERGYQLHVNLPIVTPSDPETETAIEAIMDEYAPDALESIAQIQLPQWNDGVGRLAALAAIAEHGADAALIDHGAIFLDLGPLPTWRMGGISQERFIETYKMEMQPAGTPSWNALYQVDVNGTDLARIRDELGVGWSYVVPDTINPGQTYSLIANKRTAYHPGDYCLPGLIFGSPVFVSEIWETLDEYARDRTDQCLYFDTDATLPGC